MDRLLNIQRAGGYPLCQENLRLLAENAEMANLVLASLGLPPKSAIVLNKNLTVHSANTEVYVYVTGTPNGEIIRLGAGEADMWNAYVNGVPAMVEVTATNQDIITDQQETIADVYQTRVANVRACNQLQAWKFYMLSDLLQRTRWNDMLPRFSQSLHFAEITTTFLSIPTVQSGAVLKANDELLRMNLAVSFQYKCDDVTIVRFQTGVIAPGHYPLQAQLKVVASGICYPVICSLDNGYIVVEAGRWKNDYDIAPGYAEIVCNHILYINGEVVL